MVEKEVRFKLVVDDQATPQLQEIRSNMEALNKSATKMSMGVSGGAGGATAFKPLSPFGTSANEAKELRKAMSSMDATFSSMKMSLTGRNVRKITDPNIGEMIGKGLAAVPRSEDNFSELSKTIRGDSRERKKDQPSGGKKGGKNDPNALIPGEWARPLRAIGAYRTAWFAGQNLSGKAMGGAAAIFIFQAMSDTLKKILDAFVQSSPALQAQMKLLNKAFNEIMRPMADVVAAFLKPLARQMLETQKNARAVLKEKGYKPGTKEYAKEYNDAMAQQVWHYITGKGSVGIDEMRNDIIADRVSYEDFFKGTDIDSYESMQKNIKKWNDALYALEDTGVGGEQFDDLKKFIEGISGGYPDFMGGLGVKTQKDYYNEFIKEYYEDGKLKDEYRNVESPNWGGGEEIWTEGTAELLKQLQQQKMLESKNSRYRFFQEGEWGATPTETSIPPVIPDELTTEDIRSAVKEGLIEGVAAVSAGKQNSAALPFMSYFGPVANANRNAFLTQQTAGTAQAGLNK